METGFRKEDYIGRKVELFPDIHPEFGDRRVLARIMDVDGLGWKMEITESWWEAADGKVPDGYREGSRLFISHRAGITFTFCGWSGEDENGTGTDYDEDDIPLKKGWLEIIPQKDGRGLRRAVKDAYLELCRTQEGWEGNGLDDRGAWDGSVSCFDWKGFAERVPGETCTKHGFRLERDEGGIFAEGLCGRLCLVPCPEENA